MKIEVELFLQDLKHHLHHQLPLHLQHPDMIRLYCMSKYLPKNCYYHPPVLTLTLHPDLQQHYYLTQQQIDPLDNTFHWNRVRRK